MDLLLKFDFISPTAHDPRELAGTEKESSECLRNFSGKPPPMEFDLDWLPAFKRDIYREVMRDFFQIEL